MNPSLPSPVIVVILAGGRAERFGGQDKGEILIGENRLIDIIYNRLKPQFDEAIISGTHDYDLSLPVVPDTEDAPGGPVGGIYSIWKTLEERNVEGFFTVAVDGPNLPHDLMSKLYSKITSTTAVDMNGRHPTYGWWRMTDLTQMWVSLKTSESISLNRLADLVNARSVAWEGDETFLNVNRPVDLELFVKGT